MRADNGHSVTGKELFRSIWLLALIGAVGFFFEEILAFLVLLLITVLLATLLADGASLLMKARLPRTLGVLITLLLLVGAFAALGYVLVPPFVDQLAGFLLTFPEATQSLQERLQPLLRDTPLIGTQLLDQLQQRLDDLLGTLLLGVQQIGTGLLTVVAAAIIVSVSAVYMAINPSPLVEGFLRLLPRYRRERGRQIIQELHHTLNGWLKGTALEMAAVGVLASLIFWIIGLPFPLLFGVFVGLLEIIPYFGPVIATIPVTIVALSISWSDALVVVAAMIVIEQLEGNLLLPLIMQRAVTLHPAVVALGIVLIERTLGILGVFVAVPILASAQVLIRSLWVERMDSQEKEPRHRPVEPSEV
ncbi:MAG: AI-2E family transporter [Rubrobacteraceae bacterium]